MRRVIIICCMLAVLLPATAQAQKEDLIGFWKFDDDTYTEIYEFTDNTIGLYGIDMRFEYEIDGNVAKVVVPNEDYTDIFKLQGKERIERYQYQRYPDMDTCVFIGVGTKMQPPALNLQPGKYYDVSNRRGEEGHVEILGNGDAEVWNDDYDSDDNMMPMKYLIAENSLYFIIYDKPSYDCIQGKVINEHSFFIMDKTSNKLIYEKPVVSDEVELEN